MSLQGWTVQEIPKAVAQEIVVKNHYPHRKAPCSKAFGLFNEKQELLGVVMYGVPASRSLCVGLAGLDLSNEIYELTRLWVDDSAPKNGESFLIGNSLRNVNKKLIVSYAEVEQGHLGVVYQATNWFYTGLSARHSEWRLDGVKNTTHSRHLFDEFGGINGAKKHYGSRLQKHERARKHRYVFINAKGKRKAELLSKLNYKITNYPKVAA